VKGEKERRVKEKQTFCFGTDLRGECSDIKTLLLIFIFRPQAWVSLSFSLKHTLSYTHTHTHYLSLEHKHTLSFTHTQVRTLSSRTHTFTHTNKVVELSNLFPRSLYCLTPSDCEGHTNTHTNTCTHTNTHTHAYEHSFSPKHYLERLGVFFGVENFLEWTIFSYGSTSW